MGQQNTVPQGARAKTLASNQQQPAANIEAGGNNPYTSFSVSKDDLQKSSPANQATQQPNGDNTSQMNNNNNYENNDGILTVVKGSSNDDENSQSSLHKDELIEQLNSMPRFQPLVRHSVEQGLIKDLIFATSRNKHSTLQELGMLNKLLYT